MRGIKKRFQSLRAISAGLVLIGLVAAAVFLPGISTEAQTESITCGNKAFLSQSSLNGNSTIRRMLLNETPFPEPTDIAEVDGQINAMGYSVIDNAFYGVTPDSSQGTPGEFFRITEDGDTESLGVAPGLPAVSGPKGFFAGDIRSQILPSVNGEPANGWLYLMRKDDNVVDNEYQRLYAYEVINRNTPIKRRDMRLSRPDLNISDFAFNPRDGRLYGFDDNRNRIVRIHPVANEDGEARVDIFGASPVNSVDGIPTDGAHGAAWFNPEGILFTYLNRGEGTRGRVFTWDVQNGAEPAYLGNFSNLDTDRNDGASCPFIGLTKDVDPPEIEQGGTVTYTYSIRNNANQPLTGNFFDDLNKGVNSGRTYVGGSLSSSLGGTASNYGGNSTITINNITVDPNSTATFTIQVKTAIRDSILSTETYFNQAELRNIRLGNISQPLGTVISDYPGTEVPDDPTPLDVLPLPGDRTYLRVYGNDVAAGSRMGEVCSIYKPQAQIRTYANQKSEQWVGAGSQFGAIATGDIETFFSASQRTSTPQPALGLTFGNYTGGSDYVSESILDELGGNAGFDRCLPDYFALGEDKKVNGNQTLGSTTLPAGTKASAFIDGDLHITGPIQYAGGTSSSDNWSSLSQIPSLYVVVRGNIYIDPGVSRLDGIYIAQPEEDGSKGEIRTCATNTGAVPSPSTPSTCGNKLTINGAFVARQVQFKRTNGNLADATFAEGKDSNNIAEVFNFSPEIYLSPLDTRLIRSVPFQKYDYITSLPPVL